jgi:hypothetical protein
MIRNIVLSKSTLLKSNHYYTDYDFNWDEDSNNNNLLKFPPIKFKFDFIEDIIKKNVKSNYIGIHIRRGNGTMLPELGAQYSTDLLRSKTKKSDMNIVGWRTINNLDLNSTPYIPDDYYFQYMDRLILQNKKVKFFMSYDIPYRFVKKFKDKYGDRIKTSSDFLHEIENELSKVGIKHELIEYKNTINNVIDLFSLSMCKSIISNPMSSWTLFLKQYKNIKEPTLKEII